MMTRGFLPNTDSGLLAWSGNFLAQIQASGAALGLSQLEVDAFAVVRQAFASALATALAPETRTGPAVQSKNDARAAIKIEARRLAHRIEGHPGLSDAQRAALGLTIRRKPTRIAPVEQAPALFVAGVNGHELSLRLQDAASGRSTLPPRMAGANLYWAAGADEPLERSQWQYYGSTTRTRLTLTIPPQVPIGTTVWVIACWTTPRSEPGPTSRPRAATVNYPASLRMAA